MAQVRVRAGEDREGDRPVPASPASRPSVAATIRVGRGPDGITVAGSDVWVADAGAGTLRRIDAGSNRRA